MPRGLNLTLDWETADRITTLTLKDWRDYIRKEQEWYDSSDDKRNALEKEWGHPMWVHPEDFERNKVYLDALNTIIGAYGG